MLDDGWITRPEGMDDWWPFEHDVRVEVEHYNGDRQTSFAEHFWWTHDVLPGSREPSLYAIKRARRKQPTAEPLPVVNDTYDTDEAEFAQIKRDVAYWNDVLEPLGLKLMGFTYRSSCLALAPKTGATVALSSGVVAAILEARRVKA